ncbi:MAG: STAS domain-containing protein [Acidobacteria bacterium]|nr:STAS domain-containing protein [Acidobacteriota bacterium]
MFNIKQGEPGVILMSGRLDAAQAERAQAFMDQVEEPHTVDFAELDYISSAGLAVLLRTQKHLMAKGAGLRIVNISPQIMEIFHYAGFDQIFQVSPAGAGT